MIWQDLVIMICNLILGYSAIILVYKGFKLKKGILSLQSAIFFPLALYSMAVSYFTLGLIFSAVIVTINATCWFILLLQKLRYG